MRRSKNWEVEVLGILSIKIPKLPTIMMSSPWGIEMELKGTTQSSQVPLMIHSFSELRTSKTGEWRQADIYDLYFSVAIAGYLLFYFFLARVLFRYIPLS